MNLMLFNTVETILCTGLFTTAVILFATEYRIRVDRKFTILGFSLLFIGIYTGLQVWIYPLSPGLTTLILQHVVSLVFPVFICWYIILDTGTRHPAGRRFKPLLTITIVSGIVLSFLFITGFMLTQGPDEISATLLYRVTYLPYMGIILLSMITYYSFFSVNSTGRNLEERQSYFISLIFFSFFFGVDIFGYLNVETNEYKNIHSLTAVGAGMYSISALFIFARAIKGWMTSMERTEKRSKEITEKITHNETMAELGENIGFIASELKNYLPPITSFAEIILARTSEEKTRKYALRVFSATKRLSDFTLDILNFSRIRVHEGTKKSVNVINVIRKTIYQYFENRSGAFNLNYTGERSDYTIKGDPDKLINVFNNFFRNSLEAGASNIDITLKSFYSGLFCKIEDNGEGCSGEAASKMFDAFFTTKTRGTGLGMCISQQILEKHNASISVYPKIPQNTEKKGLSLQIFFHAHPDETKNVNLKRAELNIVLIQKNVQEMSELLEICKNIRAVPHFVYDTQGIEDSALNTGNTVVLGNEREIKKFRKKYGNEIRAYPLEQTDSKIVVAASENKEKDSEYLTEDFLISHLPE
ncbi:MAG: ATP-binding protein [Chitinivibrionales bacterium]